MSRLLISITTVALTAAVFAGCISADDNNGPVRPDLGDVSKLLEVTHEEENGHQNASLHAVATPNMALTAFHSLAGDGVEFVDGNAEVTYHDGYAYVATLGATSGFVIVDVNDPANPVVVGRYSNPNVYSPDVKVTDDGKYALLSSHPGTTLQSHLPPETNVLPSRVTDPTAYTEEDHVTGVTLVDISDKTAPKYVDAYISEPNGVHNTEYAKIDGRDIVFTVDRNMVGVLEIKDTPQGTRLVPLNFIMADDELRDRLPGAAGSSNANDYLPAGSHDVVHQVHPVTKENLAYIAFGRAGFYIYNVDNPDTPALVSTWRGLPEGSGYYHYARPVDVLIDDYHVTIVAPEVFADDDATGTIAFLDTTDPKEPKLITEWSLPGEDLFIEKNYRFSPHNLDIFEGKVYLANYHAGVWVLDLTCAGCLDAPRVDGVYLPHEESDRERCAFWCERPFVWGVVRGDTGHLYASDVESGLYVIEYTPTPAE